tara:strand:+ start:5427 stop:5645 length:219 start_codon:yes stop_codon:yes gene_type:complete
MKLPKDLWEPIIGPYAKPTYRITNKLHGRRGIWWLDYRHDGERIRKSLSTKDKTVALERRKMWIKTIEELNK